MGKGHVPVLPGNEEEEMTLKDWEKRAEQHAQSHDPNCKRLGCAMRREKRDSYLEGAMEMNNAAMDAISGADTDPTGAGQDAIHNLMSEKV